MPSGESGADVSDRVSSFLESLHRAFRRTTFDPATNVILVTHGLTLRLFLMRFMYWSPELFERTKNPHNAAFVVLERCEDGFALTAESAAVIGLTAEQCEEADLLEDAERIALGRTDIHLPAMAESVSSGRLARGTWRSSASHCTPHSPPALPSHCRPWTRCRAPSRLR
jgi:hypothetical protein